MYTNLNTPRIIKKSYNGISAIEISDEMFANRQISCCGEITPEKTNSLAHQILYLSNTSPEEEITLFINSPGGSISAGLALYDIMQAVPSPIRTVCIGIAASMGAILFISGDERDILPHARVMIHDPLVNDVGGSALQMQSLSEDLMRTREITCKLIAKHTNKSLEEVYSMTSANTYFYAEQAVSYHFADKIIYTIDGGKNND